MPVPKMSLVIAIRRRLQLTTNLLPTALRNAARKDHEILIVVDTCPMRYEIDRRPDQYPNAEEANREDAADCANVARWINLHQEALALSGVRVLYSVGDERCWTGGLRCAAALNIGVRAASTEWIVGIGDEDLCMAPAWDEALWDALQGHDPMRTVSTPTMVMPGAYPAASWPTPWDATWIHAQRARVCHQLSFPLGPEHVRHMDARISERTWLEFTAAARQGGIHEEPCGARNLCHWVPMLMHRDLLTKVGMWPADDDAAFSFDIRLDDNLNKFDVRKRMPLDSLVLHMKHHLFIDDEVDRTWADDGVLAMLKGAPIL